MDFALGMALLSYGQVQKAETIVDRMLKTATPAEVNLLLGAAQLAAGDAKTAVSTLHTASDANGDLPEFGRAMQGLIAGGDGEAARPYSRRP